MAANDGTLHCVDTGCKFGRVSKKDKKQLPMIQCSLCYLWFHDECVGVPNNPNLTWWPCPACRTLSTQVKLLHNSVNALVSTITEMKSNLATSLEQSSAILEKCVELSAENDSLKECITQLTSEVQRCEFKVRDNIDDSITSDDDEDVDEMGALLIGDDIIRSIQSTKDDLKVTCLSGAKVSDIKKSLKQIDPRRMKYKELYIVCGTNDVATKKSAEKIADEFCGLLKHAKERSETVYLASVIPRSDDENHGEKLSKLNALLDGISSDNNVSLVDNDKNFRYKDGSIDESLLLADGLHLTEVGIKKLINNLGLSEKTDFTPGAGITNWGQKGVPTTPMIPPKSSPTPGNISSPTDIGNKFATTSNQLKFRGPGSSLSNFYSAPLFMWGLSFPSNEHAFQFRKAMEMGQHATAELIRQAPNPRRAQLLAKDIRTDDRWIGIKQSIMYELLEQKSRQCPTFRHELIRTHDAYLIEDTAHDYWGRGPSGKGLNVLGRLLMTLRQNLPPDNVSSVFSPLEHRSSLYPPPSVSHRQVTCDNCGEKSHTRRSCKHPFPLRCHGCSEIGHKRKSCPKQIQH